MPLSLHLLQAQPMSNTLSHNGRGIGSTRISSNSSISVSVINLNNGEGGYQAMSHEFYADIMAKPYSLLPLSQGPPPLNQSAAVIGFVALKITGISKKNGVASMSGIIVKPAVLGRSGDAPTGAYAPALKNLSPSTVRLIP
jgi:hypothetical protein